MAKKWADLDDWARNLLVAEHLMGWRWVRGRHWDAGDAERPWLLPPDWGLDDVRGGEWTSCKPGDGPLSDDARLTIFDVPHYTEDMGDAWEVVERLHGPVWTFSKRTRFLQEVQRLASEILHHSSAAPFVSQGDLIAWPHALLFLTPEHICRAALIVAGVEEAQ